MIISERPLVFGSFRLFWLPFGQILTHCCCLRPCLGLKIIDSTLMLISGWFLGAKSTSIRDCVGWSVCWLVGRSVCPHDARLRGKIIVTSRLIREEEEGEETEHVAIPLWGVLRTWGLSDPLVFVLKLVLKLKILFRVWEIAKTWSCGFAVCYSGGPPLVLVGDNMVSSVCRGDALR